VERGSLCHLFSHRAIPGDALGLVAILGGIIKVREEGGKGTGGGSRDALGLVAILGGIIKVRGGGDLGTGMRRPRS